LIYNKNYYKKIKYNKYNIKIMSLKILNYNNNDELSLYYKENIIYNNNNYINCLDFINNINIDLINESDLKYIYNNFKINKDIDIKIYQSLILKYTQHIYLRKKLLETQEYILYGEYSKYILDIRNNILYNDNIKLYNFIEFKNKHLFTLSTNKKLILPNINQIQYIKTYNFILQEITINNNNDNNNNNNNINININNNNIKLYNIKYNNYYYNNYIMMKYNDIIILLYINNNIYKYNNIYIYDNKNNDNYIYFIYDPLYKKRSDVLKIINNMF
jgi:hypothetical protein